MEKNKETTLAKAVLVGICQDKKDLDEVYRDLDELERLLETAGGTCAGKMVQNVDTINPRTVIGSGKVNELSYYCFSQEATLVVFDMELSPSQMRNLENDCGNRVTVIDRAMLILDIFALHAKTSEGKLQVELAQLKYTAPRLMGKGTALSRLGGGIGTRGPGESQLETDKRHLQRRIYALEEQLKELEKNRETMQKSRQKSGITQVAIVGYTNAGKSTLLNALTGAGILAEDKLFATLDPTTRKFALPSGENILLTDTVGFIKKLPHQLVYAFRSTLEEAVSADILVILIDAADPNRVEELQVTEDLLKELGAKDKKIIRVLNKCDLVNRFPCLLPRDGDGAPVVMLSAEKKQGLDLLVGEIDKAIHESHVTVSYLFPHSEGGRLDYLYKNANVREVDYQADGIAVTATVDAKVRGLLSAFERTERDE